MKCLVCKCIYLAMFITLDWSVSGYPIANSGNLVNKDEKQYPNGTVIGTYRYMDNEGNPTNVKYYADDKSYGVELKSVKVVNSMQPEIQTKYSLQVTGDPFEPLSDAFSGFNDFTASNKNHTYDSLQVYKDNPKVPKVHENKNDEEYETFLQNELKAPEKCGHEKVKVYFDKDKRKTRNAVKSYDSLKYCNRY